jgi:c-di-GMP-binding flagellar brake protein YcgR
MMEQEIRQHVRYKMRDGMLAVLPLPGTLKAIVGQIIDISESGLALRHKDEIAMPLSKADLILMGHEQSEDPTFEISARLVYEQEQGGNYRSGFQFGDLSQGQMSQLVAFIQSNIEPIEAQKGN